MYVSQFYNCFKSIQIIHSTDKIFHFYKETFDSNNPISTSIGTEFPMFKSKSMQKSRQYSVEEILQRQIDRKKKLQKAQWKSENNNRFYRQVEKQIFQLEKYGTVYFYFPEFKEPFECVKDVTQLKHLVEYQKKCAGINLDIKIIDSSCKRITADGKNCKIQSIKAFCKQCGPKMIMKYQCGARTGYVLRLVYFDNTHNHEKQGINNQIAIQRQYSEVQTRKKNKQSTMDWKALLDQLFQKSKQNPLYYLQHPLYRYFPRFRRVFTNYKYEIMQMKYLKWQYWYEPSFINFSVIERNQPHTEAPEENPDFFMIIHPQMKANFQKLGDICYINIIQDGIIRKKENYDDLIKFWQVISFNGLTQQNRFAPFCFCFLEIGHHTIENVSMIAHKFFTISSKTPKVIITPSDSFYDQLIQQMKRAKIFRGPHFYDPICELQYVAKNLQSPDYFKYFYNLVQATNQKDFHQNLQILFQNVTPTKKSRIILNQFLRKSRKMCFGLLETDEFIGLTFKYSGNKYMNNYYKWNFIQKWQIDIKALDDENEVYSNKYDLKEFIYMVVHQISRMFQRGINYLQNRGRYQMRKYQELLDSVQFRRVRFMVKNDIFDLVMMEYGKTLQLQLRPRPGKIEESPEMKIYDVYDKKQQTMFMVAPQPEYNKNLLFEKIKWRCNCLYSYKSGLACSHQIKVALQSGSNLFDQINSYWHSENKNRRVEHSKHPRKTRRNNQK